MEVILFLIIISILISGSFLIVFFYMLKRGQFRDFKTPAVRILLEDDNETKTNNKGNQNG
ncbi:MAG: cbb3-type cytochrome oxidase assembly protein CcoS [Lentisphaeria bacterium]|nr:cbb3-type cytochrome oxidase assembly protein CcoS [Lentisphaeria bacterium]